MNDDQIQANARENGLTPEELQHQIHSTDEPKTFRDKMLKLQASREMGLSFRHISKHAGGTQSKSHKAKVAQRKVERQNKKAGKGK